MTYIGTQIKANLNGVYKNIAGMPACDERNELINLFIANAEKLKEARNEPIECNTRLGYMYRDAGNWKTWNTVILKGAMTPEMFKEMRACCEDGHELFIPEQLELPLIREWETTEDDHPYAELVEYELVPNKADIDMTPEELLEKFREAKDNWKPEEYEPEIDDEYEEE